MRDEPSLCDSCGKPILFVTVANNAGRRQAHMPVDAEPDPGGNVAVYRDSTGRLRGRVLGKGQQPVAPEVAYCPHFATCTKPEAHRRRQRGQWTAAHSRQTALRRQPPTGAQDALFTMPP